MSNLAFLWELWPINTCFGHYRNSQSRYHLKCRHVFSVAECLIGRAAGLVAGFYHFRLSLNGGIASTTLKCFYFSIFGVLRNLRSIICFQFLDQLNNQSLQAKDSKIQISNSPTLEFKLKNYKSSVNFSFLGHPG